MLRDRKQNQIPQFSKSKRIALCSLLTAIGFVVAGLRGPGGSTATAADADDDAARAGNPLNHHQPIDLSYVPGDAFVVLAVRPASLLNSEAGKLVAKANPAEWKTLEQSVGLPLSEIEYAKYVMSDVSPKAAWPLVARMILRATHAHDWTKLAATIVHDPVAVEATREGLAGKKFFKPGPQKEPPLHSYGVQNSEQSYYVADDRTIVFCAREGDAAGDHRVDQGGGGSQVGGRLESYGNRRHGADARRGKTSQGDRAGLEARANGPGGPIIAMTAPLWQDSQRLFVGTDLSDKLGLLALAQCSSEEGATRVEQTTRGLVTLRHQRSGRGQQSPAGWSRRDDCDQEDARRRGRATPEDGAGQARGKHGRHRIARGRRRCWPWRRRPAGDSENPRGRQPHTEHEQYEAAWRGHA